MADDRRNSYTQDGVDAMKWGLVRAAIDRDIWDNVRGKGAMRCHSGNPDEGYRISLDHDATHHDQQYEPGYEPPEWMKHHRLPAIPSRPDEAADGTAYVEDHEGNRTTVTFDVWADPPNSTGFEIQGLYRKWVNRVDDAFAGWDEVDLIPHEKNFWQSAHHLREAIKPLENLSLPGESYHTACRTLGLVSRDPGAQGTTPPERMWAPHINGPIDRFVIPLQGTFLNLWTLGAMLAAQLDGMGNMWQSARVSVMEIGFYATKVMSYQKRVDIPLYIKSAGWIVGAMGLIPALAPAGIGLAAAGLVLAGADALLGAIGSKNRDVIDLEAAIPGGSAAEILASIKSTLNDNPDNGLEPQIERDDADSTDLLRVALEHLGDKTVYNPDTGTYRTCFTLDVENVLEDSAPDHKPDADIAVEFERLRGAGKIFADETAGEIRTIARGVREASATECIWERPELSGGVAIGLGTTGPWVDWNAVRTELASILDTTSEQVTNLGEYLISTANFLERQDASAKEALEKAAQEFDGAFG